MHSSDKELFDQAIFILKDSAVGKEGITDEALLREAKQLLHTAPRGKKRYYRSGPIWACGGALVTALVWLITSLV